jgi:hypothetical protein
MGPGAYGGGAGGLNKRKGVRGGAGMQDDDPYGSGRFGGPLDKEMQVGAAIGLQLCSC